MSKQDTRAQLPSLDALLMALEKQPNPLPREILAVKGRQILEAMRQGNRPAGDLDYCLNMVHQELEGLRRPNLGRVINLTGVLLHTNLGRSPLGEAALEDMKKSLSGYCNLEMDLATGQRNHRESHLALLLDCLFPGRSSLVVNNNAAALYLAVSHWCPGKEVLVSRGELVEIGGSFRITGILERAGAKVVEVGSTNRTRLEDYRSAMGPNTGMILKVHMANYRIEGYTEDTPMSDLYKLAKEADISLVHDLGSGLLGPGPSAQWPLPLETEARQALNHCDLVTFSGDKLLGGPQAGFLVGASRWLDPLAKDPLYRALRVDKQDLFLLQRLLRQRLGLETAATPLQNMANLESETLTARCQKWQKKLEDLGFKVKVEQGVSVMGGGASPGQDRPDCELIFQHGKLSAQELSDRFRRLPTPVVARVQDGSVIWNLRTLLAEDEKLLLRQMTEASFV